MWKSAFILLGWSTHFVCVCSQSKFWATGKIWLSINCNNYDFVGTALYAGQRGEDCILPSWMEHSFCLCTFSEQIMGSLDSMTDSTWKEKATGNAIILLSRLCAQISYGVEFRIEEGGRALYKKDTSGYQYSKYDWIHMEEGLPPPISDPFLAFSTEDIDEANLLHPGSFMYLSSQHSVPLSVKEKLYLRTSIQ